MVTLDSTDIAIAHAYCTNMFPIGPPIFIVFDWMSPVEFPSSVGRNRNPLVSSHAGAAGGGVAGAASRVRRLLAEEPRQRHKTTAATAPRIYPHPNPLSTFESIKYRN
eukprot:Hpha_TRINITY_DN30983_c0_g1::TRINITY_DN30983_c0_g1_i1::g.112328::m.112328